MSKDDGGAAFPCERVSNLDSTVVRWEENGMTLRDYFAAQFMERSQSLCENGGWSMQTTAQCAYEMADAMLEARKA
jgi:hypothetical protein